MVGGGQRVLRRATQVASWVGIQLHLRERLPSRNSRVEAVLKSSALFCIEGLHLGII